MTLFAATDDALYEVSSAEQTYTQSLDLEQVDALGRGPAGRVYAAGDDLYRFRDERWESLSVPADRVLSVTALSETALCVGASPPHIFISRDQGQSWHRSEAFGSLSGRSHWRFAGNYDDGSSATRVRGLASPPDGTSERIFAGVETVGAFLSDDGGDTWMRRDSGLNADVHTLRAPAAERVIAGTGRGAFLTTDAGRTWRHLFTDRPLFWFTYTHGTATFEGALYAGAQDRSEARHQERARGALLRSSDGGHSWIRERVPGDHAAYPHAFAAIEDKLYAGLSDGRILLRVGDSSSGDAGSGAAGAVDDPSNDRLPPGADRSDWSIDRRWKTVCTLPSGIRGLA